MSHARFCVTCKTCNYWQWARDVRANFTPRERCRSWPLSKAEFDAKKDFLSGVESGTRVACIRLECLSQNMSGLCCSVQNKDVSMKQAFLFRSFPPLFWFDFRFNTLLSWRIFSGEEVRTGWGWGGGLWQKWGMVSRMLFKRIIHSDSLRIAEGLIFIFQFHSPAFILLTQTGTTENQPLQTFVRGVSPLRGVKYGAINKSASNLRRRRHNHEEFKVKNPGHSYRTGLFLFVCCSADRQSPVWTAVVLQFPTCYCGRSCGNNMCLQLAVWRCAEWGTIAHLSILFIVSSVL